MRGAPRALLLALLLAAPLSAAEHVYSHRLTLEGRLLGADGLPLPGRTVEFVSEGATFDEPCVGEAPRSVTDERGDFRFCWHTHEIPAGARVGVRAGNATTLQGVDTLLRTVTVLARDPTRNGTSPAGWATTFDVRGRVWRLGSAILENVEVHGLTVEDAPVNVTVRAPGEPVALFQAVTDRFGDYALRIDLKPGVDPATVGLVVESMGVEMRQSLDAASHRNQVDVRLPPALGAHDDRALVELISRDAPGSSTPPVSPLLVAAIAVVLAGAVALARVKERKRE